MKVSVIIPVYGVREWIAECLESVLMQSYTDWECVLVNDCTMDDSIEVARATLSAYPPSIAHKVRFIEMDSNSGQGVARNVGVENSDGQWLFFLDGDDKFASNMALEQMAEAAQQYKSIDWVQGNFLRVSRLKSWTTSYYDPQNPLFDRERIESQFDRLNFSNVTNKLIRRSFMVDNGLWFRAGIVFEDAFWSILSYGYVREIVTIAQPTYYHNIRDGSTMTSGFSTKKIESLLYIISEGMLLRATVDKNIASTMVVNTLYMIKNLWLADFEKSYRDSVWQRLELSGVFALIPSDRGALRPFSRLLSVVFNLKWAGLRKLWVEMFMGCYKLYKKRL